MLELDDGKRRKRFAFLVSLLIHAVFFALCFLFISPIKVYILYDVREVIIVSDHELVIPPFEDSKGRSFSGLANWEQRTDPKALDLDRWDLKPDSAKPSSSKTLARKAMDSRITSRFKLSPPGHDSPSLPGNFSLGPSLSRGEGMSFSSGLGNYRQRILIDFSKYRNPAWSRSAHRRDPSIESARVDLSAWADKVVTSIQKLWFLEPAQLEKAVGQIKISAVVGKRGQLLSARIVDSSAFPLLEDSALNALKMSAPFPSLPEAFPEEHLEVILVFSLQ